MAVAVNVASGYPQLSAANASGAKFIPELWSGKILVKFYQTTCLPEVTSSDWEGEIKGMGDKVYIRQIPDVTIRDYEKGQTLTLETPTSTPVELLIDKAKYFAVIVDDIDKAQVDVKLMDMYTSDASKRMTITIEKAVFGDVYASAVAANKGLTAGAESGSINLGTEAAPVSVTASNAVDKLLDATNVLDEQNTTGQRYAVIPPWYARHLKSSDLKNAYLTGDSVSPLRNGKIGTIDNLDIYVSNNLTKVGTGATAKWHCLLGTRDAITWAAQLTDVETLRSTTTFGNILRGLNVYGYKVVKGTALVDLVVARG